MSHATAAIIKKEKIMPDYYDEPSYRRHIDYRKSNHKKHKRKSRITIAIIIILVLIISIAGILTFMLLNKSNPLVGTWEYDSYTQYVFEKDGNGCLRVDDVTYDYTYKITENMLILDFSEDVVRDCEYGFSIDENELTLIGGENTDGGTYKLKKK